MTVYPVLMRSLSLSNHGSVWEQSAALIINPKTAPMTGLPGKKHHWREMSLLLLLLLLGSTCNQCVQTLQSNQGYWCDYGLITGITGPCEMLRYLFGRLRRWLQHALHLLFTSDWRDIHTAGWADAACFESALCSYTQGAFNSSINTKIHRAATRGARNYSINTQSHTDSPWMDLTTDYYNTTPKGSNCLL